MVVFYFVVRHKITTLSTKIIFYSSDPELNSGWGPLSHVPKICIQLSRTGLREKLAL